MTKCNEPRHKLYKVEDFTILTLNAVEAAMYWLASLENSWEVRMPRLILAVQDLSAPTKTTYMTVPNALRRRDRERERCGLTPCWQEIAQDLDDNRSYYLRRLHEEEGGYIRYMSFDEKCQLCGKLLNSFGDVDWNATAADYKIYLEKRDQDEGGNVVICTYCWDRFVSEPELVRHLSTKHANAVLKEGCG